MIFEKERITDICLEDLKPLWLASSKDFPDFLKPISIEKKHFNEAFLQKNNRKFSKHWKKLSKIKPKSYQNRWIRKTDKILKRFLHEESILNMSAYLDSETISQMEAELKHFLIAAREFDSNLSVADLGQAMRNYLVYAIFLEFIDKPQNFNSAIFGYSMLYPVTDNFIDSHVSLREKQAYNQMIREKIKGLPVSPTTPHDIQTCQLLSHIETQYLRHEEKDIYEGLLLMLDAQQESLQQQSKVTNLSMEKRLDISLYKGGVSVLIDRYLADSSIDDEQLRFFLGFGFVLQLADDLQDISSDLSEGNQTLFTLLQDPQELEDLLNQLLQFVHQLFQNLSIENHTFKDFLFEHTVFLLLMSAHISQEHFHPDYLKKLEAFFPTHFSTLDPYIKNTGLYPNGMDEKQLLKGIDLFLQIENDTEDSDKKNSS